VEQVSNQYWKISGDGQVQGTIGGPLTGCRRRSLQFGGFVVHGLIQGLDTPTLPSTIVSLDTCCLHVTGATTAMVITHEMAASGAMSKQNQYRLARLTGANGCLQRFYYRLVSAWC